MCQRALAFLVLVAAATACGGVETSSPSVLAGLPVVPTSLPESQWLQPGRYSVQVSGFDFRADALTQICSPGGVPPAGKIVQTEIELIADGDWLIGHANAGDVNLEIRLRDAGATPGIGRGRAAVGEVRGWATDRGGDFGPATGVTFTTGTTDGAQSAAISGETFPGFGAPLSMLGSAEGHVVFSDAQNRTAVCPSIMLNLGRRTPLNQREAELPNIQMQPTRRMTGGGARLIWRR